MRMRKFTQPGALHTAHQCKDVNFLARVKSTGSFPKCPNGESPKGEVGGPEDFAKCRQESWWFLGKISENPPHLYSTRFVHFLSCQLNDSSIRRYRRYYRRPSIALTVSPRTSRIISDYGGNLWIKQLVESHEFIRALCIDKRSLRLKSSFTWENRESTSLIWPPRSARTSLKSAR